jgi:DNA-binding NtrC family response regulator
MDDETVIGLRAVATGEVFAIDDVERSWLVGSAWSCDVVVTDPFVSAAHCVLQRRDGGMVVRDRGSRNGTILDDRAIIAGQLRAGSYLTVGRTTLVAVARAAIAPRVCDPMLHDAADRALRTRGHALVVGEPGTGKQLLAKLIHDARRAGPLVGVRCAAMPRHLVASELFGALRDGYVAEATGGTLLLADVDALPGDAQLAIARVLATRRVRRIGTAFESPVDVRVIATTTDAARVHRELAARFALAISLAPVRDRLAELPLLVDALLADLAPGKRIADDARRALADYSWPGNLRELRAAVATAAALGDAVLTARDFFADISLRRRAHLETIDPSEGRTSGSE